MTEPNNTEKIRNSDGTFKVGNPGSPGRPKGQTLKEFAREYLKNLPDEDKTKYLASLPPDIVWKMAEGNPHTQSDITSGNKPIPIISVHAIRSDDSDKEGSETN